MIPYFEQPTLNIPLPSGFPMEQLSLHGFGFLVALGFMIGGRLSMDRAKRLGLNPEHLNKLIGQLVIGTFVGGHVGYGLMYDFDGYMANPIKFLYLWEGLSSMGGFLVCVPLAYYFFKSNRLPVWPYMDCLAYGLTVGWFLGRMGCFVAHDHPGPETTFFLGVQGICPPGHNANPGVACHDMGLYEALWSLSMFVLFSILDRAPRFPGFYPIVLGLAYAPTRFAMDFLRPESTDGRILMLTPAQWVSVFLFAVCAAVFMNRRTAAEPPVWAPRS